MNTTRAMTWALLALGVLLAVFGLLRADAAAECVASVGEASAARCESWTYWLGLTILGTLAAFVALALLVAPRWRSRIV